VLWSVTMPTKNIFHSLLSLAPTHSPYQYLYITHKTPIPFSSYATSMSFNCQCSQPLSGMTLNCRTAQTIDDMPSSHHKHLRHLGLLGILDYRTNDMPSSHLSHLGHLGHLSHLSYLSTISNLDISIPIH